MTSDARVLRMSARAIVNRGAGVATSHLVTTALGGREFLSGITEFAPGAGLPLHFHNCEEGVTILEGDARFEAEGREFDLVEGDATWTPAGVIHRFANRGSGRLRILWTYGSVGATRTIAATGFVSTIEDESELIVDP